MSKDFRYVLKCIAFLITFLLAVFIWLFAGGCKSAPQYKVDNKYLKQSASDRRKTVIYGADAKQKGYLMKSGLDRRRMVEYDKDGNEKGFWRQDYIDRRKTRYIKKK
jgi:hypothetical protein